MIFSVSPICFPIIRPPFVIPPVVDVLNTQREVRSLLLTIADFLEERAG